MKVTIDRFFFIISILALDFSFTNAQTTIDGEFRPRSELRAGFKKPLADTLTPALITLQRTRLTLNYKSGILTSRITLQDSRVWGQTDARTTTQTGILEAWAEILLRPGFSVTVGRQALQYDDQRIFGVSNWSNTGQAHDLILLKYKNRRIVAHLGMAYNNQKDTILEINYAVKQYKEMAYSWLSYDFGKGLSLSAIALNEGLQKKTDYSKTYFRNTMGVNLVLQNDSLPLSFKIGGYFQFGKSNAYDTAKLSRNVTFADLQGYLIQAKASYRFFDQLQLFAGIDVFSGTSYSEPNNKSFTFNKLYGTNHTFNGFMEYWSVLPKAGLKDFYLGTASNPAKNLSAEINYHIFSLFSDFQYTNSNKVKEVLSRDLGSELDLTLIYKLSQEISIQGGYSIYFKNSNSGKILKTFGAPAKTPEWAYIMLTIRPQFFKSPVTKQALGT
jgi:hypothetical protein